MLVRKGKCTQCGRCCKSFSLLGSAYSSFQEARKKYGLKLIRNPDGTYRCSMLKDNHCTIHKNKPKVCKQAPRIPFPKEWGCGYKFTQIKNPKKEKKDTKEAIHLLEEIDSKKYIDFQTQEALDYGRKYLSEVIICCGIYYNNIGIVAQNKNPLPNSSSQSRPMNSDQRHIETPKTAVLIPKPSQCPDIMAKNKAETPIASPTISQFHHLASLPFFLK